MPSEDSTTNDALAAALKKCETLLVEVAEMRVANKEMHDVKDAEHSQRLSELAVSRELQHKLTEKLEAAHEMLVAMREKINSLKVRHILNVHFVVVYFFPPLYTLALHSSPPSSSRRISLDESYRLTGPTYLFLPLKI